MATLVHIVFVNITIGTGWISAMARFLAWRRNDPSLEIMARRVFKILVIHELFSGVWGTILTVILAGLFPTILAIATDTLFYPILIALSAIIIRIPSIALFWYTWGKVKPQAHVAIGFIMGVSGFMVPMGFRYIFTEITSPHGVALALQGSPEVGRIQVLFNPLYPPLILHTLAGAMSVGGFITASFFTIKGNTSPKFLWIGLWHGVLFLALQPIFGLWYLSSLSDRSPILYSNVVGGAQATFNLLPVFSGKLAIIALLAVLSLVVWRRVRRGVGEATRLALGLGPLAILAVILGEYINDAGRAPYLVLLGEKGLPPSVFLNLYIEIPSTLVFTVLGILVVFLFGFMITAYYALNKRFLTDLPEV
ncbi:MAG: cytochrome ubiquinol oxidase subunit I [Nitrososphaerota archaeon]